MSDMKKSVRFQALRQIAGGGIVWVAIAFLVLAVFFMTTIRIGRVTGEQVGVLLNKMNGNMTVINQSGAKIYIGLWSKFFLLDKTLQTLEMVSSKQRGKVKDDLKIKTIDGSDVYVDLKVQYRINPDMADLILTTSGPDNAFKYKWARDYIRTVCRNYLGELTTEEFYDSAKRNVKILKAHKDANGRLNRFGINIDSIVIPTKPHFYEEYEAMIKKKKLADQAVLEERSKALAAKQRQQTMIVEVTNKKNVKIEEFNGQMREKIIAAEAEAEKVKKAADAYYDEVTIGAEAELYRRTKNAAGILARKRAEAQGIEALASALSGEGGRNMVKLEYAKKLKMVTITGKPYTVQSNIERFEHLQGPASAGRK